MQNSVDVGARRPIIVYIIVAIVLFAALILGVRWAKNRSSYYAQVASGHSQTASNANPSTQKPSGSGESSTQNNTANQPQTTPPPSTESQSSTPASPQPTQVVVTQPQSAAVTPTHVPSTGPEQVFLNVVSFGAIAFAGTSYLRARKRLQSFAE